MKRLRSAHNIRKNREYMDFNGISRIYLLGFKIYPILYSTSIQRPFLRMQLLRRYSLACFFMPFAERDCLSYGDAYHQ